MTPLRLAIGLLVAMYVGQRRRDAYTSRGVAEINNALDHISKGDLTVTVAETPEVTEEEAKKKADTAAEAVSDAAEATSDTANEAWDATKDAASDAADATSDAASAG